MISERIRRAYDARARFYDGLVRMLSLGHDAEYRRQAVARLGLRPGDRVLDLGCGTGLNFRYLARAVGPEGLVVGTDVSRGMLRRAAPGPRLVQALVSQRLFREASFDAVLCTYVISTILDDDAIDPMVRVLKPGGRLVVVDDTLPPGWYVGPGFMAARLMKKGWPDLRRLTVRALAPHVADLRVTFCHFGMIYIISGERR